MKECISVDCIYNNELKTGICVGVCAKARNKDVIRMCWVGKKPEPMKECDVDYQAQITPAEAVGVGVALIRSSIIGETLLKSMEQKPAPKGGEKK